MKCHVHYRPSHDVLDLNLDPSKTMPEFSKDLGKVGSKFVISGSSCRVDGDSSKSVKILVRSCHRSGQSRGKISGKILVRPKF